jgi:MFS family permease
MANPTELLPRSLTGELPETPTKTPRWLVPGYALATFGVYLALLGPISISMALKVMSIVGEDSAAQATGLVLGVGSIGAFIANPVFGRLSDRTTGRFGRRRPWLIIGGLILTAGLLVVAVGQTVPVVMVGWLVGQIGGNAIIAALLASVADQVPEARRGTVTALGGVVQMLAVAVATAVASALSHNLFAILVYPALFALATMFVYSWVLPDAVLPAKPPREGWRAVLTTFWVSPRQHPDYGWAWISRFTVTFGMMLFSTFRLFWIKDALHLDTAAATQVMTISVVVYLLATVVFAQLGGWLSDRTGRRKVFVVASTVLSAIGLAMLLGVSTTTQFYVLELVMGAAFGIYMGVDLALVMAVLPNKKDTAKDLGVFNIANAAPQALAPFAGSLMLTVFGSTNYAAIIVIGAIATVVGALTTIPIKGVR